MRLSVDRDSEQLDPPTYRYCQIVDPTIGLGDGGRGGHVAPPPSKFGKIFFSGNYYVCKIRVFFGQ